MPPDRAAFDFHGVTLGLSAPDEASLGGLTRDFAYFSVPQTTQTSISLEVRAEAPAATARGGWRWRGAAIRTEGARRTIDYEGRASLDYDLASERGTLRCLDPDLRYELAYLAVHSRVGQGLDRRGLHRVHALGFCFKGNGCLLLLPSGGGKSRLALELLKRPDFTLLSDDIPLLEASGRGLLAFPTGIGLRGADAAGIPPTSLRPFKRRRFGPKNVVDLDYFREKVAARAPLHWLLVGRRRAGPPELSACTKARAAAALALNLVLGVGAPQVLELMAPAGVTGARLLAGIAAARALCAARAVSQAALARFSLGDDPARSADALERFLS